MRILALMTSLISLLAFGLSEVAQDYYWAGITAAQNGDCAAAVRWLNEAMLVDPEVEDVYPDLKLWLGICYYKLRDFERAKSFLQLYPNNVVAREILSKIERGLSPEEEEWERLKSLIGRPLVEEITKPSTPSTQTSEIEKGKSPLLLFLGVFTASFATLLILELRFSMVSSLLAKIPKIRIVIGEAQVIKEVAQETKEEEEEHVEEAGKELEVDLEDLMNSPLDVVDRLIYGDMVEVEEEEKEEEKREEKVEEAVETEEVVEETETEEKGEEEGEKEEEKTEMEVVVEELGKKEGSETLSEEDINDVKKKVKEVLERIKEEGEEGTPLDLAGKSVEEILEELEEVEEYTQEDAKKLSYAIEKLVSGEEEMGETEGEEE